MLFICGLTVFIENSKNVVLQPKGGYLVTCGVEKHAIGGGLTNTTRQSWN